MKKTRSRKSRDTVPFVVHIVFRVVFFRASVFVFFRYRRFAVRYPYSIVVVMIIFLNTVVHVFLLCYRVSAVL
jgi:hypothetical protein